MNDSTSATGLQRALRERTLSGTYLGLDAVFTQVAIELQNLSEENAARCIATSLVSLRDATASDAVCLALLTPEGDNIGQVYESALEETDCRPQDLLGVGMHDLPWLRSRIEHMRLFEILDTNFVPEQMEQEGILLARLGIRSMLSVGIRTKSGQRGFLAMFRSEPQDAWDPAFHLRLKLIGASFATGLQRLGAERSLGDERERAELAGLGANDGMWDWDIAGRNVYFSPRWKQMLGYRDNELQSTEPDWSSLIHPDDLARVQAGFREHLDGETELFESIHRLRHRRGEWRWVLSRAKATFDDAGKARRVVGVELDITERKLYEEALFREKERAQITLQSIGDGVITTDSDCRIEYLNPVAQDLTGWKLDDAAGRPVAEIFRGFHEETCEPLENPMAVAIRRSRPIKSVRPSLLIRRDGNELYVESTAAPIRDGQGVVTGGVLVFHDVSEARELNRRLSYHASHDILTGLVNRREFENRLERALQSAKQSETEFALCYLDLDQFKIINDSCGHAAGDTLLGQLGALLKAKIRWRDTLARMGGDEFGVLLESCSLSEAMDTAEQLRSAIEEFKYIWDDKAFRITVSVGVVPITPEHVDVARLVSAADSACQVAKEAGRNRIYSFQENDIELMRRRREMQWAARITNALEESRFELFRQTIQPLQDVNRGMGAHYEILLRMRDEHGGIISPDVFIAAAERYGLTPNIDRWVIANTFRWLVSEADERQRLALCSINLSGQSLNDDKFLDFIIDQFRQTGLSANLVCFEITETAAIASYTKANRLIQSLKELGCMFALDDFGTGLSSFSYLKHFPVDFLKIDGSFVKEILHDPIDREMVRSINEIGHLTGKKTIAEFAENQEIIDMLTQMGVDYAQGFGVAEPERVMRAVA